MTRAYDVRLQAATMDKDEVPAGTWHGRPAPIRRR